MAGLVIVDYGMANLRSVQKAFEKVGHTAIVTSDAGVIAGADRLVLPGVGAFRDAIGKLRETGLDRVIVEHIDSGRPFLGICLGMQLLFTRGLEDGIHEGLNVLAGDVVRFPDEPGLKVPHMGWNQIAWSKDCPLFEGLEQASNVYFVHGYYVQPTDRAIIAAETDYPRPFASAIRQGNVFATQFHPEKSQSVGLRMLKNFAEYPQVDL